MKKLFHCDKCNTSHWIEIGLEELHAICPNCHKKQKINKMAWAECPKESRGKYFSEGEFFMIYKLGLGITPKPPF